MGISNFEVRVGNSFVPGTTSVGDITGWSECLNYAGYPIHGNRNNYYQCATVVEGRYMTILPDVARDIEICELEVFVATDPGMGSVCKERKDCLCPTPTEEDQHLDCIKEDGATADDTGICDCMSGYYFKTLSGRCINFDECVNETISALCTDIDESIDGKEDATCFDTNGSYECQCEDGYIYDATEKGCIDIDETTIENCGCDDVCTNKFVDRDGMKYLCECTSTIYPAQYYELGADKHHCMDIDECADAANSCVDPQSANTIAGVCKNRPMGFDCICPEDYYLDVADMECKSLGYCQPSDCGDGVAGITAGTCRQYVKGGWECICEDGYEFDTSATGCINVNECTLPKTDVRFHNCDHICTDATPGFTCTCKDGYYLDPDNSAQCWDIDECVEQQRTDHGVTDYRCVNDPATFTEADFGGKISDPICHNYVGDYECSCPDGYFYQGPPAATGCLDIEECKTNNGGCEHECNEKNMEDDSMMYQCACRPGFELNINKHACDDIDECATDADNCEAGSPNAVGSDNPSTQSTCLNKDGSFECTCPKGFEISTDGDMNVCNDIDECTVMKPCEHTCENTNGGYTCDCEDGFEKLTDEVSCQDIDECALETDTCAQNCHNQLGSYTCSCNKGYVLNADGKTCDNVNECELNNGGCDQLCEDKDGSYECKCEETYFLMPDNHSCDDKDECANNADNECEHKCVNTKGSYMCECNDGFALNNDGFNCDNVDECEANNGGCEQTCTDNEGGYECTCGTGWSLNKNKHSCDDVDECKTTSNDCGHHCHNNPGSFDCYCDGGYALGTDKKLCFLTDSLTYQICYNIPWDNAYASLNSAQSKDLIPQIEDGTLNIARGANDLVAEASVQFQVQRFFNCPVDLLGVSVIATPREDVSEAQLASLASDLSSALSASPLSFNGSPLNPVGKPEFVIMDGTSSRTVEIDDDCGYYNAVGYCKNGGDCVIASGQASCRCPSQYLGPQCLQSNSIGLTNMELGLIIALPLALLLFTLVGVATCLMMRRRSAVDAPVEYYDDGPSMAMQPNYLQGDYGVYGYKS